MKHVCVAAKIGADAKDGAGHIANMVKPTDKVSAGFGCNPSGWHEFWPMTLSLPLPIFAILAAGRFASYAKIVTAHHAFHYVRDSKAYFLYCRRY